jgi:hypothetical protein
VREHLAKLDDLLALAREFFALRFDFGRRDAACGQDGRCAGAGGSCGGETWRVADVRMLVDPETGVTDCVVEPLLGRSGGYDVRQGDATY